jgi:hypothetical protein
MMGPRQVAQGSLFYEFSIEDHVPPAHLLRSIDRFVDLGDMRRHLAPFAGRNGWPLTVLNLGRPAGGKLTPAIVLAGATEARERALSLWPEFTSTHATLEKFLPDP